MSKKEELIEVESVHRIKYKGEYQLPGTCFFCEPSIAESLLNDGAAKKPGEVVDQAHNPIGPDLEIDPNDGDDPDDEGDPDSGGDPNEAIISL